jgi:DNA repair exonuclease SbcCD ATPase subunit
MRFSDADEPWPRSEGGPSRDDYLYRHGVSLSDPGGLDRFRSQQLELKAERTAFQERERAEQSERWLADRLKRERAHTRELVAEMIAEERKQVFEATGTGVGKIRAELCDEIHAALETIRTRITALEQLRDELKELRRDLVIRHTSITRDGAEVIDITPSASVTRKTRGPDAA